jgi:hypothetical protein
MFTHDSLQLIIDVDFNPALTKNIGELIYIQGGDDALDLCKLVLRTFTKYKDDRLQIPFSEIYGAKVKWHNPQSITNS